MKVQTRAGLLSPDGPVTWGSNWAAPVKAAASSEGPGMPFGVRGVPDVPRLVCRALDLGRL